jgi:hypothetical protein
LRAGRRSGYSFTGAKGSEPNILGLRNQVDPAMAELPISARQQHLSGGHRQDANPDTLTGRDASQLLRSSVD